MRAGSGYVTLMADGRLRMRLEVDARQHPVAFSLVIGTVFAVLFFAVQGLWDEWSVSNLVSCLIGGLGIFGPFMTIWARRQPSDLTGTGS